jgi:carbonic anhydrase/acetyltransferase-like protein (isoleucine patch superfamily)
VTREFAPIIEPFPIIAPFIMVACIPTITLSSIIGKGSIIGANSLVTTKKQIPIHSLVMGVPGKVVKQDKQYEEMSIKNAGEYHKLIKHHRQDKYIHYRKI